ncbi:MAG TPA: hypothetical protein VLI68_06390 [Hanamia sp.]|jgi:hypothetical protein|nr:hypothetical protein [Hanamia sp.]
MKLQSNKLLENLTRTELKNLTTEVKETVCTNFKNERKKIFSAAQLWDMQRRRKNLYSQKYFFC